MSDERPSAVLGALPHRRPHRRSDKRPTPAPAPTTPEAAGAADQPATASPRPERLRQPAQPSGVPQSRRRPTVPLEPSPGRPTGRDILAIAAQAAGELAEIGLSVSARALRNAVGRLPRP